MHGIVPAVRPGMREDRRVTVRHDAREALALPPRHACPWCPSLGAGYLFHDARPGTAGDRGRADRSASQRRQSGDRANRSRVDTLAFPEALRSLAPVSSGHAPSARPSRPGSWRDFSGKLCYPCATRLPGTSEKSCEVEAFGRKNHGLKIPVSVVRFRPQAPTFRNCGESRDARDSRHGDSGPRVIESPEKHVADFACGDAEMARRGRRSRVAATGLADATGVATQLLPGRRSLSAHLQCCRIHWWSSPFSSRRSAAQQSYTPNRIKPTPRSRRRARAPRPGECGDVTEADGLLQGGAGRNHGASTPTHQGIGATSWICGPPLARRAGSHTGQGCMAASGAPAQRC